MRTEEVPSDSYYAEEEANESEGGIDSVRIGVHNHDISTKCRSRGNERRRGSGGRGVVADVLSCKPCRIAL